MSEAIKHTREQKYEQIIPQIKSLIQHEDDLIANLANVAAALKSAFNFFWVGFYLVKNKELVLGPFQGPVACTRITLGKGVCGKAWADRKSILVEDVHHFPGHISCNSASKSEIVVPITHNNIVYGVLDIDSDVLNDFDHIDLQFLESICANIGPLFING